MSDVLQENRLYTLSEVAQITGLSARNLRIWAAEGSMKAQKAGRQWYLNASQIRELAGRGTQESVKAEEPETDPLEHIDLTDIECRLADLYERKTGKTLDNDDRDELLSILEDFMRAAVTGRTEAPPPVQE